MVVDSILFFARVDHVGEGPTCGCGLEGTLQSWGGSGHTLASCVQTATSELLAT